MEALPPSASAGNSRRRGPASQIPVPPVLPRDQRAPFSRAFYKRARVGTNALVAFVAVGCLLYDWDSYLGTDDHMFKHIRPTVRRTLDWAWGAGEEPAGRTRHSQLQQEPQQPQQ
jgi:hypothetical protein